MGKLEAAEIARSKAAQAEAFGTSYIDQGPDSFGLVWRSLVEVEKLQSVAVAGEILLSSGYRQQKRPYETWRLSLMRKAVNLLS